MKKMTVGDVLAHKHGMKPEKPKVKWLGTWPANCDICYHGTGLGAPKKETPLAEQEYFVDGRTGMGPWALMCPACHEAYGAGLGTGKGQKYDSKTRIKLEG